MKKIFRGMFMVAALVAAAMMMSCNNDNNGGNGNNDAPEIIANNGVGEDGKIALNNMVAAYYLGNVWDNGVADYYVALSNDTIGQGSDGFEVPMHQGGWILYLDLWSAMSENTKNATLPEGTYTFGDSRELGCFYQEYSLATNNREQVQVDGEWLYDIKDVYFKSGTVVVEHVKKGYRITTDVVTTDNETYSFVFEGPIVFDDQSDDEDWQPILDTDVELTPKKVTMWQSNSYPEDNCDRYAMMLYNTESLTEDGLHPSVVGGVKLQVSFFPELGQDVAGHYTVGTLESNGVLKKAPGLVYPGSYYGTAALGTFVEYVESMSSVLYSTIKSGEFDITNNGDGTYTVVANFLTERDKKVTCSWTGVIESYNTDSAQ